MNYPTRYFYSMLVLVALMVPSLLRAQPAPAKLPISVKKIDGARVETPAYSVKGFQATGKAKQWFRVFAEYDSEPDWIDELNFTFYVMVKGKTRDVPAASLFKGEVTQIHIPAGNRHIVDMYIHPNVLARFGDVAQVAIEVRQGGRLLAQGGKPEPTAAWWNNFAPVEGVLLDRSKTPFALVEIDEQEIIKTK